MAEACLRQTAEDWTEACRRNVSGEPPFTMVDGDHGTLGPPSEHIALIP